MCMKCEDINVYEMCRYGAANHTQTMHEMIIEMMLKLMLEMALKRILKRMLKIRYGTIKKGIAKNLDL